MDSLAHFAVILGMDQLVGLALIGFGLFLAGVQVSRRPRRDP